MVLTLRLNNHDFVYNEEMMKADVKTSYNMFKILDKVRHCIKHRGEEKMLQYRWRQNNHVEI